MSRSVWPFRRVAGFKNRSMKTSQFTVHDLRAALEFRAAGAPRPDLAHRIRQALRAQERPALVVMHGTRGRGLILARYVATAAVVAALVGVGFGGQPDGTDLQLGRPGAVVAGFEADEGADEEDDGDDAKEEGTDADEDEDADDADDADDEGDTEDDLDEELDDD